MKKAFLLIAFLFTVVCYAAPPPNNSASFLTEDVGVFRSQGDIDIKNFDLLEVAFAVTIKLKTTPILPSSVILLKPLKESF